MPVIRARAEEHAPLLVSILVILATLVLMLRSEPTDLDKPTPEPTVSKP